MANFKMASMAKTETANGLTDMEKHKVGLNVPNANLESLKSISIVEKAEILPGTKID